MDRPILICVSPRQETAGASIVGGERHDAGAAVAMWNGVAPKPPQIIFASFEEGAYYVVE
jgi:hypothetical protein